MDNPRKYLRLPIIVGRSKKLDFAYIQERVILKMNSWKCIGLYPVGQQVLLKLWFNQYVMNIFLIPSNICKSIERAMNGLL